MKYKKGDKVVVSRSNKFKGVYLIGYKESEWLDVLYEADKKERFIVLPSVILRLATLEEIKAGRRL